MALPVTEGHGMLFLFRSVFKIPSNFCILTINCTLTDLTTASGVSMKQYEEQLNGLRKENFHLKLRIYFLEEKLGSGSPPAVQVSFDLSSY